MKALLLLAFLFSGSVFAQSECNGEVGAVAVEEAIVKGLEKGLNVPSTAYSYGLSLISFEAPKTCEKDRDWATFSVVVVVDYWSEEGETGTLSDNCIITVDQVERGVYEASYLQCEELDVERQL